MPRITELANELTSALDRVSTDRKINMIAQVDSQLFSGWRKHPCIQDEPIASSLRALHGEVATFLAEALDQGRKHAVVFSGCGTSGRIAWLCAQRYNEIVRSYKDDLPEGWDYFRYRISGGDQSLVISNELPEDDPVAGARDLKEACEGAERVLFVGITCGLSAAYVAGQVDYSMSCENHITVLIGFNPVSLARDSPVEGWDRTSKDVFLRLEKKAKDQAAAAADAVRAASPAAKKAATMRTAFVLNPIPGPEAVTGSSRMKGGSLTKILLDSVFLGHFFPDSVQSPASIVSLHFDAYKAAARAAPKLAAVIELAAAALRNKDGHLYYVGLDPASGFMGLIDASEMVDTYGAREDEVHAFFEGGWVACGNHEGDLSHMGSAFHLSLKQFRDMTVATPLTRSDAVIVLHYGDADGTCAEAEELMTDLRRCPAKLASLVVSQEKPAAKGGVLQVVCQSPVFAADGRAIFRSFQDLAMKLLLNIITTVAHVEKGAVIGNTMINLTVSNNKLFHRSAEIISKITGADDTTAKECLMRAIYDADKTDPKWASQPLSDHIKVATPRTFMVPTAALLATGRYDGDGGRGVAGAREDLASCTGGLGDLLRTSVG